MFGQGVVSDFMFAKDAIFAQADAERRGVPACYAQMHAPIARAAARARPRRSGCRLGRETLLARAAPARHRDGASRSTSTTCERLVRCLRRALRSLRRRAGARRRRRASSTRSSARVDLDELIERARALRPAGAACWSVPGQRIDADGRSTSRAAPACAARSGRWRRLSVDADGDVRRARRDAGAPRPERSPALGDRRAASC